MGACSGTGLGVDAYEEAIFAGRTALRRQEHLLGPSTQNPVGAFAPDVPCPSFIDSAAFENADRALRLALFVVDETLGMAKLSLEELRRDPLALVLGTSLGNMLTAMAAHRRQLGGERVDSGDLSRIPLHALTEDLARLLRVEGLHLTVSNACVSGVNCVGTALDLLRDGEFSRALCIGVDSFHEFTFTGFASLWALSDELLQAFDRGRKGTLLGEGAAAVLLETDEAARGRGAVPLAEVLGYGMAADAVHVTAPDREGGGAARAMIAALADGSLTADAVDVINANATGSGYGDASEAAALHRVFGARAASIPISSVKPVTGHSLGAAGLLETIASVLSLRRREIPPNAGTIEVDPACDVDAVLGVPRPFEGDVLLSHGSGFGGANATLLFRRVEGGGLR